MHTAKSAGTDWQIRFQRSLVKHQPRYRREPCRSRATGSPVVNGITSVRTTRKIAASDSQPPDTSGVVSPLLCETLTNWPVDWSSLIGGLIFGFQVLNQVPISRDCNEASRLARPCQQPYPLRRRFVKPVDGRLLSSSRLVSSSSVCPV